MKMTAAVVSLTLLAASVRASDAALDKWLFVQSDCVTAEATGKAIELITRAQKAGYNGVEFIENRLYQKAGADSKAYLDNLGKVRQLCRDLKMKVIVAPGGVLSLDPNLAEGVPVVAAPFTVQGGKLVAVNDAKIVNPSFEDGTAGWQVDAPGDISVIDSDIKAAGKSSLRLQNINGRNARVSQMLNLKPFHSYHLSVMIKTEGFAAPATFQLCIGSSDNKRALNPRPIEVTNDQNWTKADVVFNTLDYSSVNLMLGSWGGTSGKLWLDDFQIEPAGFVNVVRRQGAPVKVASADGKTTFKEGADFAEIKDPALLQGFWHEPPAIAVPGGSALKEGQQALISYYQAQYYLYDTIFQCMCEPKVAELYADRIHLAHRVLDPDGYIVYHSELRCQGWDESCKKSGLLNRILCNDINRCAAAIRKEAPGKDVYVQNDMIDPNMNAKKTGLPYFGVAGDDPFVGSLEGVDKDIIILNWNWFPNPEFKRADSVKLFAAQGHKQILMGFYDATLDNMSAWLHEAENIPGVTGAMYTTWVNDYSKIEAFSDVVNKSNVARTK